MITSPAPARPSWSQPIWLAFGATANLTRADAGRRIRLTGSVQFGNLGGQGFPAG